ncbi:hypothetical protein K438DRAFT_1776105 [Mycena galopus ATCC 62051]|nr:hypothetical protein K438DRAFT_1776105 [Mycena galopus ATCC 62051]
MNAYVAYLIVSQTIYCRLLLAENVTTSSLVIAPDSPSPLKFAVSKWIWSSITATANAFVVFRKDFTPPVGKALIAEEIIITPYAELTFQRAFRRTFSLAPGQVPQSTTIIVTADNAYTLYKYLIYFASVAVLATNTVVSPAGVALAMEVNMVPSGRTDCTAGVFWYKSVAWKSMLDLIPAGFEQPNFDDLTWPAVVTESAATWGTIAIAVPSAPITAATNGYMISQNMMSVAQHKYGYPPPRKYRSSSSYSGTSICQFKSRKFGLRKNEIEPSTDDRQGQRGQEAPGQGGRINQVSCRASTTLQTQAAARNERRKRVEGRNRTDREVRNMCAPRPPIKIVAKHRDSLVPKAGDALGGQRPPPATRWVRLDRTAARG